MRLNSIIYIRRRSCHLGESGTATKQARVEQNGHSRISEFRDAYCAPPTSTSIEATRSTRFAITPLTEARTTDVHDLLKKDLASVPIGGTVVLILHGIDGFTANVSEWTALHRQWSIITIYIAINERYLRLRQDPSDHEIWLDLLPKTPII